MLEYKTVSLIKKNDVIKAIDEEVLNVTLNKPWSMASKGMARNTLYALKQTVQVMPEIEKRGWISVKERLPDKKGTYLVFAPTYSGGSSSGLDCNDGVMFARWRKHWSIEVGYHKRPNCVTHWMPLPDAPEVDDE